MAGLETALRRAALWARRGMPKAAAELLAGTEGALRFRPEQGDLAARLPGGGRALRAGGFGRPATAPGGVLRVSAGDSSFAGALALVFAHGPLAGIAPALVAERDGSVFRVRACWHAFDGSVAVEARGRTVDACHEKIARLVLRLWPELEEAAEWL